MMVILRQIVSLFVVWEMLLSAAFSGSSLKCPEMPEAPAGEYGQYVDPFTGTGGIPWTCGMLSPAACAPFGCVRLGPDTAAVGGLYLFKTNTSGYYYEHRHILGFSYGRLSGTGARDYGMFRVTPAAGRQASGKPAALTFSHNKETASPGYYAVYLPGAAAMAEMTATAHAGYMRYTFGTDKDASLFVNAASSLSDCETRDATITVDPDSGVITGSVVIFGNFSERFDGLKCYYYAETDKPIAGIAAHTADGDTDETTASGDEAGLWLNFGDMKDKSVTLRAGISFVSAENAKENLYAECGESGFDEVAAQVSEEWEERLGSIKTEAAADVKQIFYTSLYHSMIMPTDFTDYNGSYIGFDKQIHMAEGFTYRTDLSLWDTARDTHALYTLIAPDVQTDSLKSLLLMADQGGVLPRWPMGAGYTGSMIGSPANLVFTESYLKGIDGIDYGKALGYMIKSAETVNNRENREMADIYNEYGYLPDDIVREKSEKYSVSRTLEYSWADAAIATLAGALGETGTAEKYSARAMNYRNVWDAETLYFRAKNSDGSWGKLKPKLTSFYDEIFGMDYSRPYCEGSARHWRWSALQDIDGMISLFGSSDVFVRELEDFMEDASLTRGAADPGSGYWIGNQHDLHTPYLFADAGRADLTQKWVRWTLANRFAPGADGLDGNDDGGTLSAWYVFSSMGLYPLAGTDLYWIGSPCVESAEITLPNGKTLTVKAENQSDKNVYVSSVKLNGETVTGPYITHDQLMGGGVLTFSMCN